MIVADILLAVLANWALVEVLHHGSLFERPRAWLEAREGLIAEWVSCAFCLSHWTALATTAAAAYVGRWSPDSNGRFVVLYLLAWLVVVRLSNLLNDIWHDLCRTPPKDDNFDL